MKELFRWQYVLGGAVYFACAFVPVMLIAKPPEPACADFSVDLFLLGLLFVASVLELPTGCVPTFAVINATVTVLAHRFGWDWGIDPRPWFDSTVLTWDVPASTMFLLTPLLAAVVLRRWVIPRLRPLFHPKN